MTKAELKQRLIEEHIPEDWYSIEGGFPYDSYVLSHNGRIWEVYYTERGKKFDLKRFKSEEEACAYFYNWLIESLKHNRII